MSLRQRPLFPPPDHVSIAVKSDHDLVVLTKLLDWDQLTKIAMAAREKNTKKQSGPTPRYRPLLGAVTLMAIRHMNFRQAEDQIAHYAPARYLCGLMECDWTPDHVTIYDFTKMLGAEGLSSVNAEVLKVAEEKGFADPSILMADTTAQEAQIPYPTEVGLMGRFVNLATKGVKKLGGKLLPLREGIKETVAKVKGLIRNSHLFAKTPEKKRRVAKKLYYVVKDFYQKLENALGQGYSLSSKAGKELEQLTAVMKVLLPQIWHYLQTGFVARGKIIHLQMSELYSIVRGKAGKSVEFGLKWGINRLGGGYLAGYLYGNGEHASDPKFCMEALKQHIQMFGEAPKVFGYDRGGYSQGNISKAKKLGVKHVGIAPKGLAAWEVSDTRKLSIQRERVQIEGNIGNLKREKYRFNKPDAHSKPAMARCGQKAILGYNLQKLAKDIKKFHLSPMPI